MSLGLYADVNFSGHVIRGLQARGVDVLTAQADGQDETKDPPLLDRAAALGRVLVTHDEDFLNEGSRRQQAGEPFAGVIYAHQRNVSIGQCVKDLELIAKVYDPPDMANQVQHLPL